MSSEEQQLKEDEVYKQKAGEMDIDSALVLYRNLQYSIDSIIDEMTSPVTKHGKRKTTNVRLQDLRTLGNVIKIVVKDLDIDTAQFEDDDKHVVFPKALSLYSQIMAVQKAKQVIKEDLKAKIMNGEVENISEELKQKVLKDL